MPGLVNIDVGGIADAFKPAIEQAAKHYLPDANEQAKLVNDMMKIMADAQSATYEASAKVMTADAAVEDKYTRRARPTVVYWALAMITAIYIYALFSVEKAKMVVEVMGIIPEGFWTMATVGVGIFGLSRGIEKSAAILKTRSE